MTITIYLSKETNEKLKETRQKYHVSLSTIAQILSDITRPMLNEYPYELQNEYIDKNHREKTSIKPNNTKENSEFFKKINFSTKTASHIYSNLLYLYANENYKYIFNSQNEKECLKWSKDIEKELSKKREIYWNYNNNLRNNVRIIKKNKDYFLRILQ